MLLFDYFQPVSISDDQRAERPARQRWVLTRRPECYRQAQAWSHALKRPIRLSRRTDDEHIRMNVAEHPKQFRQPLLIPLDGWFHRLSRRGHYSHERRSPRLTNDDSNTPYH